MFSSLLAAGGAASCVPDERPERSAPPARGGVSGNAPEPSRSHAFGNAAAPAPLTGPQIERRFVDSFERGEPGARLERHRPGWTIKEGRLCVSDAHNHPAWLRQRLPPNARIEFEATSASAEGDLKAEVWGDGRSAATGNSYGNATSYLVIFGG